MFSTNRSSPPRLTSRQHLSAAGEGGSKGITQNPQALFSLFPEKHRISEKLT
jgi:hypothetical protein